MVNAPEMVPSSMWRCITGAMRFNRAADIPTSSGMARGSPWQIVMVSPNVPIFMGLFYSKTDFKSRLAGDRPPRYGEAGSVSGPVGRGPVPRRAMDAGDRPPRYGEEGAAACLVGRGPVPRQATATRRTGPRTTVKRELSPAL